MTRSVVGRLRAVIFDFDGVLADAEPLHFRSLAATLAEEGVQVTEDDYRAKYIVLDDRKAIQAAFHDAAKCLNTDTFDALLQRKARRFDALLREGVALFPGVPETVRRLAKSLPIAIASSALRQEILTILGSHGLADAFLDIVGAEEVTDTKPHPAPYLEALARINRIRNITPPIRPDECAVIEDTIGGIQGAKAAGMFVVAVTNSYPADRLTDADRIITTLEGMTPESLAALLSRDES